MPTEAAGRFDPEVALLLENLDRAYDHTSWHGPNPRSSVRRLSAAEAAWRPAPGRHSAAQQVLHAAYWKYAARRRLNGEKRGSFPLKGTNWFATAEPLSEADWRGHLELLDAEHRSLRSAVAALDHARLREPSGKATSKFNPRSVALGIAAHDLYHAGQIQLLNRLRKGSADS